MAGLGVAIAGTGFMGWAHTEALRRAGQRVVGILGSTGEKSQAAAQAWDIPTAYSSFSELLADADVQSVHIGTPNRHHFQMAKQALEAGKHVMCEKPLAMNAEQSAELVRLAAQHPRQACGVNYNIRFYPLCMEAQYRMAHGDLGRLFHVTGSYVQDWLLWETDYNWRVSAEEGGTLRAVADIGTHWLDLIQHITGSRVSAVCADLSTVHEVRQRPADKSSVETFGASRHGSTEPVEVTTEDYGAILLQLSGGARGCLHVSQVTAGRKNCLRFELAGSKQSLAWNSEACNRLFLGHRDRPNEDLVRDPALLSEPAAGAAFTPGGHNEGYADTFKACFRAFYDAISSGHTTDGASASPSFPTFADGHYEVVLCEAILQSHRSRRWVDVQGD